MTNKATIKGFALFLILMSAASAPLTANTQTQQQMNDRAQDDYGKADKAMNVAYKKLMSKLDAKGKTRLKKAQIAWLKFRDAEADFLSYDVEEGSIYGVIHPGYMQEITEKRTKELNAAYKKFTTEG